VFSPDDFRDLGDPRIIGMALTRLVSKGTIRRLARGLYDFPKTDPVSGPVSPTPDAIAKALAGKHNLRLLPSGAYAASLLGLSEDKPAPIVFLTDGSSRNVRFGNQEIMLKQTTPRMMGPAGRLSGLVIQALRHLGQEKVNAGIIQKLKEKLTPKDRQQLLKDAAYAPAWVAVHLRAIATDETSP
jgi:hypothetical protein